jgi:hypothetical protein
MAKTPTRLIPLAEQLQDLCFTIEKHVVDGTIIPPSKAKELLDKLENLTGRAELLQSVLRDHGYVFENTDFGDRRKRGNRAKPGVLIDLTSHRNKKA